jgi:hypothetical protein
MMNVLLGAATWQVPRWEQEYYPQDLPEEWQLSYYANEFSTTLIDCHHYLGAESLDHLGEILEDCHDEFRPVLSVHCQQVVPAQLGEFIDYLELLDPEIGYSRLAGVYMTGLTQAEDCKELAEWRARVPEELPLAVDDHGPEEISHWMQQQRIYPVWQPEHHAGERSNNCWLTFMDPDAAPRELAIQTRSYLDSIAESDFTKCIIADKGYEDIQKLNELKAIIRLING